MRLPPKEEQDKGGGVAGQANETEEKREAKEGEAKEGGEAQEGGESRAQEKQQQEKQLGTPLGRAVGRVFFSMQCSECTCLCI